MLHRINISIITIWSQHKQYKNRHDSSLSYMIHQMLLWMTSAYFQKPNLSLRIKIDQFPIISYMNHGCDKLKIPSNVFYAFLQVKRQHQAWMLMLGYISDPLSSSLRSLGESALYSLLQSVRDCHLWITMCWQLYLTVPKTWGGLWITLWRQLNFLDCQSP